MDDTETPPHRYLFNSYVYQYHLMQFAIVTVDMVYANIYFY